MSIKPYEITPSLIAEALEKGYISEKDMQFILEGWHPQKRSAKEKLFKQAKFLGVFEILRAEGLSKIQAKQAIRTKANPPIPKTTLNDTLEKARKNWLGYPHLSQLLKRMFVAEQFN